jgi:hypothetical protein
MAPFQQIRIAHPTRLMAQKLLIHDRRERRSRAKDILYLHDTIELFGASLDVLREDWELAASGKAGAFRERNSHHRGLC